MRKVKQKLLTSILLVLFTGITLASTVFAEESALEAAKDKFRKGTVLLRKIDSSLESEEKNLRATRENVKQIKLRVSRSREKIQTLKGQLQNIQTLLAQSSQKFLAVKKQIAEKKTELITLRDMLDRKKTEKKTLEKRYFEKQIGKNNLRMESDEEFGALSLLLAFGNLGEHFQQEFYGQLNDEENNELLKNVKRTSRELALTQEKLIKKYDELKVKEGVMDFGDLIVRTLELFRKRPNVLKEYKKQFKYILVDEFQDTNISQNELVKLLSGKDGNITVVLDDDQSIYRFRGAAVSNALYFRKNFSKAKIITLTKNYRSHQQILDTAYQLIQHNNPDRLEVIEKINKKLVSQGKFSSGNIERLKLIHKDRVENEADEVAKEIKKLIIEEGFEYKDIAVLVRANNHADPFMRAFSRYTIPYQFLGPGRLFRQPEIIDLISYLKVLYDFTDSVSMHRLLSMEYFNIDSLDLIKIGNYSKKKNILN